MLILFYNPLVCFGVILAYFVYNVYWYIAQNVNLTFNNISDRSYPTAVFSITHQFEKGLSIGKITVRSILKSSFAYTE